MHLVDTAENYTEVVWEVSRLSFSHVHFFFFSFSFFLLFFFGGGGGYYYFLYDMTCARRWSLFCVASFFLIGALIILGPVFAITVFGSCSYALLDICIRMLVVRMFWVIVTSRVWVRDLREYCYACFIKYLSKTDELTYFPLRMNKVLYCDCCSLTLLSRYTIHFFFYIKVNQSVHVLFYVYS